MKKQFNNRMQAIEWIAQHAESEAHFELWREQLMYNFLYTGQHFVEIEEQVREVVWLDPRRN